jgi:hypothetical protein
MKPNEAVQFLCGDCQAIFELRFVTVRETEVVEDSGADIIEAGEPSCCPFCGACELKRLEPAAS